jgi:hypothetical protein
VGTIHPSILLCKPGLPEIPGAFPDGPRLNQRLTMRFAVNAINSECASGLFAPVRIRTGLTSTVIIRLLIHSGLY